MAKAKAKAKSKAKPRRKKGKALKKGFKQTATKVVKKKKLTAKAKSTAKKNVSKAAKKAQTPQAKARRAASRDKPEGTKWIVAKKDGTFQPMMKKNGKTIKLPLKKGVRGLLQQKRLAEAHANPHARERRASWRQQDEQWSKRGVYMKRTGHRRSRYGDMFDGKQRPRDIAPMPIPG